jgi:hypothetical protein
MDPTSLSTALVVYGPLGVFASAGIYWKWQGDKALAKAHEDAVTATDKMVAVHRAELQDLNARNVEALQQLSVAHRAEVNALMDRFVELVETSVGHYRQVIDKVSTVIDAISRTAR